MTEHALTRGADTYSNSLYAAIAEGLTKREGDAPGLTPMRAFVFKHVAAGVMRGLVGKRNVVVEDRSSLVVDCNARA